MTLAERTLRLAAGIRQALVAGSLLPRVPAVDPSDLAVPFAFLDVPYGPSYPADDLTIEQSPRVHADSDIGGLEDLDEARTVGAESGTTGEALALANVPGAEIRSFDDTGDLCLSLIAGTIDAVNAALEALRADGTYDELLERFFGG